jgi:hypothetical protein
MPSGVYIGKNLRRLVEHHLTVLFSDAEDIFSSVFMSDENQITLKYLTELCNNVMSMSKEELDVYLAGPIQRPSKDASLNQEDRVYFKKYMELQRYNTIKQLHGTFTVEYYEYEGEYPLYRTLLRAVHRENWTCKVTERRNINRDPVEGLEYLEYISYVDPKSIIDIDETAASSKEFYNKYGWAPRGERHITTQFYIGGRHFSVIAAYCTLGFVCWRVVEGTYGANEFISFLEEDLKPYIDEMSFGIIDNSQTHKTLEALESMNKIFRGLYRFVAAYSPHLKPIEQGFGDIKKWLREHEAETLRNPLEMLEYAFEIHSVRGEFSGRGKNFYISIISFICL